MINNFYTHRGINNFHTHRGSNNFYTHIFFRESIASDWYITGLNIRCFLGEEARKKHLDFFFKAYTDLESKGFAPLAIFFPRLPLVGPAAECVRIRQSIYQVLQPIVEERVGAGERHPDYLDSLLQAGMPLEQVLVRLNGIFFAAHVNTVKTLLWAIINLIKYPDTLAWIREDVDRVYEESDGHPTAQDLVKLNRIEWLFKEGMRTLVFSQLSRDLLTDLEWEGYLLPQGDQVAICPVLANLDPALVGPSPQEFRPQRWADANASADNFFGGGGTRCKGEQFASQVLKVSVATLVREYNFSLLGKCAADVKPHFDGLGSPTPEGNTLRVRIVPRAHRD